jgi:hypothetical protein
LSTLTPRNNLLLKDYKTARQTKYLSARDERSKTRSHFGTLKVVWYRTLSCDAGYLLETGTFATEYITNRREDYLFRFIAREGPNNSWF